MRYFGLQLLKIIHENIFNLLSLNNQKAELEDGPNVNLATGNLRGLSAKMCI